MRVVGLWWFVTSRTGQKFLEWFFTFRWAVRSFRSKEKVHRDWRLFCRGTESFLICSFNPCPSKQWFVEEKSRSSVRSSHKVNITSRKSTNLLVTFLHKQSPLYIFIKMLWFFIGLWFYMVFLICFSEHSLVNPRHTCLISVGEMKYWKYVPAS